MEKYRKIEWNKDRKIIKEINDKYSKKDNPEPISLKNPKYKEENSYRENKKIKYKENHLFLEIAGGIIIGGFILFLIVEKVISIQAEELAKELEKEAKRIEKESEKIEERNLKMLERSLKVEKEAIKNLSETELKPLNDLANKRKGIHSSEIGLPKIDQQARCKPAKINGVWQQHCE